MFVSSNSARMDGKACATGKHPVPPYTSCTRNNDCPSGDKCKGIPTDKSWGLFEVQLPLKVPAACWNYGTDTKPHKRCDAAALPVIVKLRILRAKFRVRIGMTGM